MIEFVHDGLSLNRMIHGLNHAIPEGFIEHAPQIQMQERFNVVVKRTVCELQDMSCLSLDEVVEPRKQIRGLCREAVTAGNRI